MKTVASIVDFFDPNNPEHCRAWQHLTGCGVWPKWFWDAVPNECKVDISPAWASLLQTKMSGIHVARMATPCEWKEDEDGNYHTGCGNVFGFFNQGPIANKMKWCGYCSHPVKEVPYKEPKP